MKKKGFTLIELLAVIVILAIIALITIPVTLNIIENAKKGAFEDGLYSIFDAYSYEKALTSFDSIGEKDISSLNLSNNKYSIGKVGKVNGVITLKNVSDGAYCANGTKDNFQVISGNCSNLDETAPEVKSITYTSTSNSLTVTVNFSEPDSFIKDVKFRLLDESNNVIVDYIDYDTLSGSGENRIAIKTFNNLEQNKLYKVEVQIENMAIDNNLTSDSKSIQTSTLNKPTISYNTNNWELSKTVTITYNSNVTNSYKVLDENYNVIEENIVSENTKTLVIDNYDCTVIALSNDGVNNVSENVEIGYIDKEEPIISPKEENYIVSLGADNIISSTYFNIDANGLSGIASTSCVDTTNSNVSVSNTITLQAGTYNIKCTVTKGNGLSSEASVSIKVGGPTKVEATSGQTHKGIVYLDPTNLSNECNASNSVSTPGTKVGCMKWYIYSDSGDTYKMILDHNTTAKVAWNSSNSNSAMKEVATALTNDTATWNSSLNARLIEANEIARITGNTTFNQSTTPGSGWFYLDNNGQSRVANSTNKSAYAWLFDYTQKCTKYGCNIADSSTEGYWTSSPVAGDTSRAWSVDYDGTLFINYVEFTYHGVRPVISISKSIIY